MVKLDRKIVGILIVMTLMLSVMAAGCTTQNAVTPSSQATKTITDFSGAAVTVPAVVNNVTCLHPIPTFIVWRLAPQTLKSVDNNFKINMYDEAFTPSNASYLNSLPVTGNYFTPPNTEQILSLHPDVIVTLNKDPNATSEQALYGAPVVQASKNNLTDYPADFTILGNLLGNEKVANQLADFWNNTIANVTAKVSQVPGPKPKVLYYNTKDANAPSLPGPSSVFASEVRLAGGVNYYDTNALPAGQNPTSENIATNVESVLAWNPDVIITTSNATANAIMSSPTWQNTNAVKDHHVYTVPQQETMDGVQSIMGFEWAATVINPGRINVNFVNDTKTFDALFYENANVSTQTILAPSP
jgi:iron complex transport system substrate-binding protein